MHSNQLLRIGFRVFVAGLLALTALPAQAQWTVSTPISSAVGLEDGMARDHTGNLFVSQYQGDTVRRIAPDGTVSVFANGFNTPNGLAVDAAGNVYVANVFGGRISRVTPAGVVTQEFISVANPSNIIFNAAGDSLYIAHYRTSRISKVALADPGNVSVWVSGQPLSGPIGMALDDDGNLYTGNYNNGNIFRISPGGDITQLATIQSFLGFLVLSNGWLYATSYNRNEVYRLRPDGSSLEVIAGSGSRGQANGTGTAASFDGPNGILASVTGDTLYVSEFNTGNLRMLVSSMPTDTEVAGLPASPILNAAAYPNPFQSSAAIEWTQARPGHVSIDIYNLLGQRVRTLTSEHWLVGSHSVQWDGRDHAGIPVPTASYFYHIRAEDSVHSGMLLRQ